MKQGKHKPFGARMERRMRRERMRMCMRKISINKLTRVKTENSSSCKINDKTLSRCKGEIFSQNYPISIWGRSVRRQGWIQNGFAVKRAVYVSDKWNRTSYWHRLCHGTAL